MHVGGRTLLGRACGRSSGQLCTAGQYDTFYFHEEEDRFGVVERLINNGETNGDINESLIPFTAIRSLAGLPHTPH